MQVHANRIETGWRRFLGKWIVAGMILAGMIVGSSLPTHSQTGASAPASAVGGTDFGGPHS